MKKVLLLYNTVSGISNNDERLLKIITDLNKADCRTTVYPISPEQNLTSEKIVNKIDDSYDVIACAGGDGTLNHLINALHHRGLDIPIGYIPSGSTNDFARSIGNNGDVAQNCDTIAHGRLFRYDLGKLDDLYFNYIAAFGAFTKVSYTTNQNLKNALGYTAYVLNVIRSIPDSLSYHVHLKLKHDQMEEEGDYLVGAVANTASIGGVQTPLLKDNRLDDGKFQVIMIQAPKNLIEINEILGAINSGDVNNQYLSVFSTDHLEIEGDQETEWTVDGEFGGSYKNPSITVLPKASCIYVPQDFNGMD